jgi:hypothetical protein
VLPAVFIIKMKAKDYFTRYVNEFPDNSNEWKVIKTFRDIFCEAQEIAKNRNAKTDTAYQNIFKELNQKANSFCRMVNEIDGMGLKNDAFMIFVQSETPDFYRAVYPNGR